MGKIPKTINSNGCWISYLAPTQDGYVTITIEGRPYRLHRLIVCIYHNLDYEDKSFESRHSKGCNRRCFFHEHLKPGTISDNVKDSVLHNTHPESSRAVCKDGHPLDGRQKSGGKWVRFCKTCKRIKQRK